MEENKVIHATLVRAKRDIMGDLESIVIKDDTGKKREVTIQQVETALKNGIIEIEGLRLTTRGNVKETRRPRIKKTVNPKRKKLEDIQRKIDKLDDSKDLKEKQQCYKLRKKLEDLLLQEEYFKEYEAIQRKLDRKK